MTLSLKRRMRLGLSGLSAILALAMPVSALAWGATGHRIIAEVGIAALPTDLPAFLHRQEAIITVGEYARELDRSKGAGRLHDSMRDPSHFIDLDDQGLIYGATVLEPMAATRSDYETALRAGGTDSGKAGLLPYALVDGWQQVTKDFAYWRVLNAALAKARDPKQRAWIKADLDRRETLILINIGVWAHYVGDASQPMHTTLHFNGWGEGPNPKGYTMARTLHASFEGALVRQVVNRDRMKAAMMPFAPCGCTIEQMTVRYLRATNAQVVPLYELEKAGALVASDARGQDFVNQRLAAGASSLRDMVTEAWIASAKGKVGWPEVSVADVVSGKADAFPFLYGQD
jgi:hypothetical protein